MINMIGTKGWGFGLFLLSSASLVLYSMLSKKRMSKNHSKSGKKEKPSTLQNSVKKIERHVIVCGMGPPESWPKRVEEDEASVIGKLTKLVDDFQDPSKKKRKIKITGCDLENTMEGYTDIIVYPDSKIYRVSDSNLMSFATLLTDPAPVTPQGKESASRWPKSMFHDIPTPFETLLLVCSHQSRDKRCGRTGPNIIEAARALLAGKGESGRVKCTASTHIGGHEFAGTLIVYPVGNWFGHVSCKGSVLAEILDSVASREKGCVERCYRGNSELQW